MTLHGISPELVREIYRYTASSMREVGAFGHTPNVSPQVHFLSLLEPSPCRIANYGCNGLHKSLSNGDQTDLADVYGRVGQVLTDVLDKS